MLKTLFLILPVLVPSWRFFQSVEASARVQWAVLDSHHAVVGGWRALRPLPLRISAGETLLRLFWSPDRNEALYMLGCAERLGAQDDPHAVAEIISALRRDRTQKADMPEGAMLRFRLEFVQGAGEAQRREIVFVSDPFSAFEKSLA